LPSRIIKGNKTTTTSAHLKNTISKTCTLSAKYFVALCIKTKQKPEIIIKIIERDFEDTFEIRGTSNS
jgi:hypothetical protein